MQQFRPACSFPGGGGGSSLRERRKTEVQRREVYYRGLCRKQCVNYIAIHAGEGGGKFSRGQCARDGVGRGKFFPRLKIKALFFPRNSILPGDRKKKKRNRREDWLEKKKYFSNFREKSSAPFFAILRSAFLFSAEPERPRKYAATGALSRDFSQPSRLSGRCGAFDRRSGLQKKNI